MIIHVKEGGLYTHMEFELWVQGAYVQGGCIIAGLYGIPMFGQFHMLHVSGVTCMYEI